jgi:hypothetical protein
MAVFGDQDAPLATLAGSIQLLYRFGKLGQVARDVVELGDRELIKR